MNQTDMVTRGAYDTGVGNAIGGDYLGGGQCYALQLCDDFATTSEAYIITQVEVANLFLESYHDVPDARVSIYLDLDGYPSEEPVFSARVSEISTRSPVAPLGIINTEFFDEVYQSFYGVWTTITGLWIALEPESSYFICVQVDAGPDDWAYTCIDEQGVIGADSFLRDGPPEEDCQGSWGFSDWRARGSIYRKANSAYRVVAVGAAPPRPGDFDGDGTVTTADLGAFVADWGTGGAAADLDGDGDADTADFLAYLHSWVEGR